MTLVGRLAARARALDRSLGLLAAMAFITQLGVSVMLPLLPLYAQSLGATPFVLGLLISGFGVTLAAGQLAAGFMADRIAPRRLVVTGLGVYAAANIAIAISTSAAQLIVYRGVAGLGAGIGQVAERLYIGQVAARARLAFANSIISAAYSAGTVAGPAIGGLLAHVGDLHLPFVVVGLTSFAAAAAGWFLPRPPERIAEPASGVGSERLDGSAPAAAGCWCRAGRRRLIVRRIAVLFVVQPRRSVANGE